MKKLLVLLLLIATVATAQIKLDEGYVILNNGSKLDVLLPKTTVSITPKEVSYYESENGNQQILPVSSVMEYGFKDESAVFKRFNVDVSESSYDFKKENKKVPIITPNKMVFLEKVIDSHIDLYVLRTGKNSSYYVSNGDNLPELLIYNTYQTRTGGNVLYNNSFREVLFKKYGCPSYQSSIIADIDYNRDDIKRYVINTNECLGYEVKEFKFKKSYPAWSFLAGTAITFTSIDASFTTQTVRTGLKYNQTGIAPILRVEYNLDRISDKFAVQGELTYNSITGESNYTLRPGTFGEAESTGFLDYKRLGIGIGARYNVYISNKIRLYPLAQVQLNVITDKPGFTYDADTKADPFANDFSFNVALGLEVYKKFAVEFKTRLRDSFTRGNTSLVRFDGNMYSVGVIYRIL